MKSWMGLLTLALILAGGSVTGGCNDESGGGFRPKQPKAILQVEPGAWFVETTLAGNGTGCLPSSYDTLNVPFCDGIDLAQQAAGYGLHCTFQVVGNQITASCGGDITVANCTIHYSGGGRGNMTAGGRSFQIPLTVTTTAGAECGGGVCNYTVAITGVWRGPGPCGKTTSGADERMQ